MAGFYIYVSSKDSSTLFPKNRMDNFVIELDREIVLALNSSPRLSEKFGVALTEINIKPTGSMRTRTALPESCVVLCVICETSYIKGTRLPVLRVLPSHLEEISGSLFQPYYIEVNTPSFKRLHFQLKTRELQPLNAAKWDLKSELVCTLHFVHL